MLIKPPALHDEVLSNRSNSHSPSLKQRHHKKQSTIKLTGLPLESNDMDNQSIHSNGSKASKTKRAKEGSLGGKITIVNRDQDDDKQSIHSGASKKSHKVNKKQNSLGKAKATTFRDAIGQPQEQLIQQKRQQSPSIIEYVHKEQTIKPKQIINHNPRFSPFEQIEQHADDGPIFRIEEPSAEKKKEVIVGAYTNKINSKMNDSPINAFDGTIISQESRLVQTRNQRRRKQIFGPRQFQNVSKVESIGLSSVIQDSRRKSKSKLGELIRQSREKQKVIEQSKQLANPLNDQSRQTVFPQKSRMLDSSSKPAVAASRMVQVERKILSEENDNFAQEDSKSDLNLSVSRNNGQPAANQKDSLIFNFQPQKKKGKGLSITSKEAKKEMYQLPNNLISKDLADNSSQLLEIQSNLISREIPLPKKNKSDQKSEDEKKILQKLKENDDYISNSGLLNLSEEPSAAFGMNQLLKQAYHKQTTNDFMKKEKTQVVDDEPWHKIVSEKQVLKKVERKEVLPAKEKQEAQRKEKEKREYEKMIKIQNQRKQLERREYEQQMKKKEAEEREEKLKMERKLQLKRNEESKKLQSMKKLEQIKKFQQMKKREEQNARIKRIEQQKQLYKIKAAQQRQQPHQFQPIPTTITAPLSEHSSDGSHGSARKKSKSKKETTIKMNKPHKIQIRAQSPRQQESFYEESEVQVKFKEPTSTKQIKQPNILSFDDKEIEQNKPKSKTDINFYPGNSQLSLKNPSSKPPLSRKSNASSSKSGKSKPKQSTLPIMVKNQKPSQAPMKKLTILQRAMMARQQDSGSQVSSGSRDGSINSRESRGSNGSKKSAKKQTTLNIQLKPSTSKPPVPNKRQSDASSDPQPPFSANRTHPNLYQMEHKIEPARTIISKDTYFIDGNGRLVKQDLVIKGNEVYGRKGEEDVEREVYNRMRRSRQRHRSRSQERQKSRQSSRNGSRIQNQSKFNGSNYNTRQNFRGGYQTSENESAEQTTSQYTSSTYYAPAPAPVRPTQSPILREFLKPVEHVPMHQPPKRLNQMFGESGVRRVMGRTEGSRKKYDY